MRAQTKHQLEVWGKYSEQIEDYTRRGLTEKFETPRAERSGRWSTPTPTATAHDAQAPDQRHERPLLDARRAEPLLGRPKGPKYVVYLPNAGHGLDQNRDYALHGIGAFFRHATRGRPLPRLTWSIPTATTASSASRSTPTPSPGRRALGRHGPRPRTSASRTGSRRRCSAVESTVHGEVPRPTPGIRRPLRRPRLRGEGMPYHLSTQIRISGEPTVEKDGKTPAAPRRAPVPAAR